LTSPQDKLAWRDYEAYLLAELGRFDEAMAVAEAQRKDIVAGGEVLQMGAYWQTLAGIELARGEYDSALTHMQIAVDSMFGFGSMNWIQTNYMLARAYLGAGKSTEAVREFEKLLGAYGSSRHLCQVWILQARYLLGQAYENLGETSKAIESYEAILEQWREADEGIPLISQVRARLSALTG
jgi:tetratricopeptide (TPR) repeat protein